MYACLILTASVINLFRVFLDSFDAQNTWSVYLSELLVCIFTKENQPQRRNQGSLLLCRVETILTVTVLRFRRMISPPTTNTITTTQNLAA